MPSCLKEIQAIQWERSVLFKAPSSKYSQTSCESCRWISLRPYQPIASWKATKSKHWTWPANFRALPWPTSQQSNKSEQSTTRGEWVSIIGFAQQNCEAVASQLYGLSQSGPRGKTYTAANTCCYDLLQSCLKWPTTSSTSNYSAPLLFWLKYCDFTSYYFGKAYE